MWSLREITAELVAQHAKLAVDHLLAMGERAPELRVIGASLVGNHYEAPAEDIARAWDSIASGAYRNVARAMAAQILYSHGKYEAATERIAALVADLDLRAEPPQLNIGPPAFQQSRRGMAGWQLVWTQWAGSACSQARATTT